MLGLLTTLQKRPSDRYIRIFRVIIGASLLSLMLLNAANINFSFVQNNENLRLGLIYFLAALGCAPIFSGITNVCLTRKKYVQRMQMGIGVLLFLLSFFMYVPSAQVAAPTPAVSASGTVDFQNLTTQTQPTTPFSPSPWVGLIGFIFLIAGATGKCITEKCMKYAEKITKIRV